MSNILLIEDDSAIQKLFKQCLESAGYEVHCANDGEDGINLFRSLTIDLVITDMVMPKKEGVETIFELKHESPGVKIIAISGGGLLDPIRYLALAKAQGVEKILQKPIKPSLLLSSVKEVLELVSH
jgi:DNA-binding response OmpR family regulator